jgi:hypothetical protein
MKPPFFDWKDHPRAARNRRTKEHANIPETTHSVKGSWQAFEKGTGPFPGLYCVAAAP